MDPRKALAVVVAKAGSTAETVAAFLIVRDWLTQALKAKAAGRIAAVTSADRGDLLELAKRENYRTFCLPGNVGGRYRALTAVGLLPSALIGIDIRRLTRGAAAMTHLSWQPDLNVNIALRAAFCHWLLWTRKNKAIQVAFPYSNHLWGTAFWFRQLWAESLGKPGTGQALP